MTIAELDTVALVHDLPAHGLLAGDTGAVVHVHTPDDYEVEFVTADGRTAALLTLTAADVRPLRAGELLRVREFTAA